MARESFALSISTTDHLPPACLSREREGELLYTLFFPFGKKIKAVYPPRHGLTVKKESSSSSSSSSLPPGGIITEAMKRENTNRKREREGKKVEEKISRNGFSLFFPHCTCNSSCTVAEKNGKMRKLQLRTQESHSIFRELSSTHFGGLWEFYVDNVFSIFFYFRHFARFLPSSPAGMKKRQGVTVCAIANLLSRGRRKKEKKYLYERVFPHPGGEKVLANPPTLHHQARKWLCLDKSH